MQSLNLIVQMSYLCLEAERARLKVLMDFFGSFNFTDIFFTVIIVRLILVHIKWIGRNGFVPFSYLVIVVILDVLVHTLGSFPAVKNLVFHVANCRVGVLEEVSFLVIRCVSEFVNQPVIIQDCISKLIKSILRKSS
jgi:hypothetical protein